MDTEKLNEVELKDKEAAMPLVSVNDLQAKHKFVITQCNLATKGAELIKIESIPTLSIAIAKEGEIKIASDELEKSRKSFKAPYLSAAKVIDKFFKEIQGPINKTLSELKNKRLVFQADADKAAKDEMPADNRNMLLKEDVIKDDLNKLIRISRLVFVNMFGGKFKKKDGTEVEKEGSQNPAFFAQFVVKMNENFPIVSDLRFPSKDASILMRAYLTKTIEEYIELMVDLQSAVTTVESNRVNMQVEQFRKSFTDHIFSERARYKTMIAAFILVPETTEKATIAALASRSIKEVLDYDVINIALVPREYLMIDEAKIKLFMKTKDKEIRGGFVNKLITGIKFKVTKVAVTK